MTNAETVARKFAQAGSVNTQTAIFVRMDSRFAVVNIGASTITVPCVGFYPPVAGMAVRVDWVNGSPAVTGPVVPLNPLGVISGTGVPKATVTVDSVDYMLFYREGYTPTVGDAVEINWATGVIQGKVTGTEPPKPPDEAGGGGGGAAFTVVVKAASSGRWDYNWSNWWGDGGPWASNSNDGIWTYLNRVKDAVGGGTVEKVEIFLPLIQSVGSAAIALHPHAAIPGGAPALSSITGLSNRSGWVTLPASFGAYLAAGGRGVGVTAPSGGNNQWRGVKADSSSGALRITGKR